jgi:antitoxin (DNA-binding transcriptional repressor) of toxin-antitoxin stability system
MQINAAEFRTKCFKILDQVKSTIITKRGKPIAKLTHIGKKKDKDPLLGALSGSGQTIGDLTLPVSDPNDWEID